MCVCIWFRMFFVTVLTGSETGPKFPLAMRPVKQSGLWKFWPYQVLSTRVKKNLSTFPFFIGLQVQGWLLKVAAQWPKAGSVTVWPCWGKVLWGQQILPSCCTETWVILELFAFDSALYSCRGSESHGASAAGRELYTKLKLSWTDLNFTIFWQNKLCVT